MAKVARGKALVAKLRAQPGVRDPEALAAELGRKKALRHAAKKVKGKLKDAAKKVENETGPVDGSDPAAVKRRFEVLRRKAGGDPTVRKWNAHETGGAAYNPDMKMQDGQIIRELPRGSRESQLRMAIKGRRHTTEEDRIHGSRHERIAAHRAHGA